MKDLTDTELVKLIEQGNDRAFTEIHKRYENLLYSYVGKKFRFHDNHEDVVSECWIKINKAFVSGKYEEGKAKISTYICRIAHNKCIDKIRKYNNSTTATERSTSTCDDISWEHMYQRIPDNNHEDPIEDQMKVVYRAIDHLPIKIKEIMIYRLDGYKYDAIAEITGRPEGTVKTSLFRARAIIKGMVEHIEKTGSLTLEEAKEIRKAANKTNRSKVA